MIGPGDYLYKNPFDRELAKALYLHERALFFATEPPKDLGLFGLEYIQEKVNVSNVNVDPESEENDVGFLAFMRRPSGLFLSDIKKGQTGLTKSPSKIPSSDVGPHPKTDFYSYIHAIYLQAFEILVQRLQEVSDQYLPVRDTMKKSGIGSDRNEAAIRESKECVIRRSRTLLAKVNPAETQDEAGRNIEEHANIWDGLNNICRLLMDEITHLSSRLNEYQDVERALSGFRWTKAAIWISVFIGCISITKDVFWSKEDVFALISALQTWIFGAELKVPSK